MNAYELANNLENKDRLWAIDENLLLNTCEMLRQQADLIKQASQFIQEQGLERQWIVWSTLKKASEK
jgi:hypothetical protein